MFGKGVNNTDSQAQYIIVDAKQLPNITKTREVKLERQEAIHKMYESFKGLLKCLIIQYFREKLPTKNDVIITICMGKKSGKNTPHLDVDKGNTKEWNLDQIINQYIKGVRGFSNLLANIPKFTVAETLRYLHTNPETKVTAPTAINEKTPFKPVLANRVLSRDAFVSVSNIIAKDVKFLESLSYELAKFNPNLVLKVEEIIGDDSEVVLKGHQLNLSHRYINLVIRSINEDDDSSSAYADPSLLETQDDMFEF